MTTVYRRVLAAGFLAGTLTLSMAGVASAHACLVRANIKPGQVFAHNAYPRMLTAFFAENVNPTGSWVHVFEGDPKGDHVYGALGAAMSPAVTQQALSGPYRVVLHIGPVEKMYTLAQYHKLHPKSGEIMLRGMMTMATGTMGMNTTRKPHHLEVHIYSRRTERVVANVKCAIAITDLHTKRKTMVPVVVMEGIGEGPQDLHYGNNVMLMTEHYRVDVTINSVRVSFSVFWHEPSSRGM